MKRPLNSCWWGCCSENYFWGELKVHPHVSSETKTLVRNEPPEQRRENRGWRSILWPFVQKSPIWKPESALLEFLSGVHQFNSSISTFGTVKVVVSWVKIWHHVSSFELTEGQKNVLHYFLRETGISCFNKNVLQKSRLQLQDMFPFYRWVIPSMVSRLCK